jgi:putative oligomerization/nucleic acid binding protein
MGMADELQKLEDLHRRGALTDEEFTQAKALVLRGTPAAQGYEGTPPDGAWQGVDPTVDPDRDLTPQRLRVMQIIAFGLLNGLVIFLAISLFIVLVVNNGQGLAPPQGLPVVSLVAGVMLAVCGPLSVLISSVLTQAGLRQILAGAWQVPQGTDPAQYLTTGSRLILLRQTTMIIGLALLEGPAFTGCIAYLLEGQVAVLVVPGVVILLMLLRFPTERWVRVWLEHQAEVLAELRAQDPEAADTREEG